MAHSVDTRRIDSQKGRYNIPNIGLFLWRLDTFSLTQSPAFPVDDQRYLYLFSPLGNDMQLFTRPESETDISHLAEEPINVPEPISRRVLDSNLDPYYGSQKSLLVAVDGEEIDVKEIKICNLADDNGSWAHLPENEDKIAIDPVLGRIAFPPPRPPENVRVTFHYGFSMAMGGGEYERRHSFVLAGSAITVTQPGQGLQNAIDAVAGGIVEIGDSGRYEETIEIKVDADEGVWNCALPTNIARRWCSTTTICKLS